MSQEIWQSRFQPRFQVEEFTGGKWRPLKSFKLLKEAEAYAEHLPNHRIIGVIVNLDNVKDLSPPLTKVIANYVREFFRGPPSCSHGIPGGLARGACQKCADEQRAAEDNARRVAEAARERARIAEEAAKRRQERAASAKKLKSDEVIQLRQTIAPSAQELRRLSPQRFEDEIARMFKRLGYAVKQTPYSNDYGRDAILMKNGEKFLLECKRYNEDCSSGRPDLQKFHSAIISDKVKKGFFVTTGKFTQGAQEFAATAAIDLIDTNELLRLMFESLKGASQDDSYSSLCLECGHTVIHNVRSPANALCNNGHTVSPTLSVDELLDNANDLNRPSTSSPRAGRNR